jgi:protein N-terminal glutamine amidohydrolase
MNRDAYPYAPYYCEENIWHLCQEKDFRAFDRKVVLISNDSRTCALWNQRAQPAQGKPVLWDYHVVMLFMSDGWQVYDLDTLLLTPISIAQYIRFTFGYPISIPEEFLPLFRVIDADEFVDVFSSDRSHMLTADGHWQVEPPPWPAIIRSGKSNLMELIDMQKQSVGTVMDLTEFKAYFK